MKIIFIYSHKPWNPYIFNRILPSFNLAIFYLQITKSTLTLTYPMCLYSAGDCLQTVDYGSQFKPTDHITENHIFNWPVFYFFHCFVHVFFKAHHFLSALKRNPSAFSSQMSFIICFHCNLFFPVTSHLSLHFSQLKIAIMDISNQVSFDFHSLFCHLFLTPSTCTFLAITTCSVFSPLYFTVCSSSLCPVYHHPSLYFIGNALGNCVFCVGYQLQLSSRWCCCFTVSVDVLIRCTFENTTLKHLR